MMLPDSNIWLALAFDKHAFHRPAAAWLAGLATPETLLLCRATQHSLLRLLTTRAVAAPYGIPPLANTTAWGVCAGFLVDERVGWAEEPLGLEAQWRKWAGHSQASPKLWMDAYLAAFAFVGGHRLVTTDLGFRQFAGLNLLVLAKN